MNDAGALAEARRRAGMTSLGAMDEVRSQMATVVASASKLTDIEDVVAAMGQVNTLARQYYEMGIARLQRIDAIEESIANTNQQIKEQIELAGMGDQEKLNYYFSRMTGLRSELERTTNEEEIARITAQMQQYVQSALGLAPNSKENRDKLLGILGDIGVTSSLQLEKAREEQAKKDKEALDLQQKQLDALIGIEEALGGRRRAAGKGKGDEPTGPKPKGPRIPLVPTIDDEIDTSRLDDLVQRVDRTLGMLDGLRAGDGSKIDQLLLERFTTDQAAAIGKAVADRLHGLSIRGDETLNIDLGDTIGTIVERFTRNFVLTLQSNPDLIAPRG
jgi:hypothetical protein